MPRIPQPQRRYKAPTQGGMVAGNISAAGQEFREMARFGEALSETGRKFNEAMVRANYASELSSAKVQMRKAFNDLDMEIAQDPDYTTYIKRFTKGRDIIEKDLSGIFTTETARRDFANIFDEEATSREFLIKTLTSAKNRKKLEDDFDFNIKSAITMGDISLVDEILYGAKQAGIITEGAAGLKRAEALQNIDIDRAYAAINHDPAKALEMLRDPKMFPNMKEKDKRTAIRSAESEIDRKEKIRKKEKQKVYDDTDREFFDMFTRDELTMPHIQNALREDTLEPEDARIYFNFLEKKRKEREKEIPVKTDPDTYLGHRMDITDGVKGWKTLQREIKKSFIEKLITQSDMETLINKVDAIKTKEEKGETPVEKDPGYKRAIQYLKSQIMPNRGLLVGESSIEAKDYYQAMLDLDTVIVQAEEAGKPLSGNDIVRKAMEMAPLYKKTMTERIRAMRELMKKGIPEPEKKKPEKPEEPDYLETAIDVLMQKNKLVNDDTIKTMIERIKKKEKEMKEK